MLELRLVLVWAVELAKMLGQKLELRLADLWVEVLVKVKEHE
jgi:hypothetical protein